MGPILAESEVSGYYMFYKTDRLSETEFSYELKILDQNLNELISQKIEGTYHLYLVSCVYNNETLLIKFYDSMKRMFTITQYDNNAEEISVLKESAGDTFTNNITMPYHLGISNNPDLFPMNKCGFIDYRSVATTGDFFKCLGFEIDFYPSQVDRENWTFASDKSSLLHNRAKFIYGDKNIILSSILKNKKFSISQLGELSLLALDTKTGEKVYEKIVSHPKYQFSIMSAIDAIDEEGNITLFGFYYPKEVNEEDNSTSLGMFSAVIDSSGNFSERNYISWEDDASKFVDINKEGFLKDIGNIFFHDIIKNADGNIYLIGEQYSRNHKIYTVEIVLKNLMIFQLNSDYEIQEVKTIEKEKSVIDFPLLFSFKSPQYLASFIKFENNFIQSNKDKSIFSYSYTNKVKIKRKTEKLFFGNITYTDSELSQDYIEIEAVTYKKDVSTLPAKLGNVVIVEYLNAEKELRMRIEKINY